MRLSSIKSLVIGGCTFTIQFIRDNESLSAMAEDHGAVSVSRQIISVNATEHIQQQWNSLNHEIKHVVNHLCGIDDKSDEETEVNLTTNMMCAFWSHPSNRMWLKALNAYVEGTLK